MISLQIKELFCRKLGQIGESVYIPILFHKSDPILCSLVLIIVLKMSPTPGKKCGDHQTFKQGHVTLLISDKLGVIKCVKDGNHWRETAKLSMLGVGGGRGKLLSYSLNFLLI